MRPPGRTRDRHHPATLRNPVTSYHDSAELDRLRAELEELTGKPVQLNMVKDDGPPKGRKEVKIRPELTAG